MKKMILVILAAADIFPVFSQTADVDNIPVTIRLTDSVRSTPVKDQSSSPTCWVFGTNSLIESDLMKRNNIPVDLSEMFIARHAYIDKAKQFLLTKGKTYFEGGGQFHDVLRVIESHGMVPEAIYNGKPGGENDHNHAGLDTAMKTFIHGLLKQGKTGMNGQELQQVNDTLDKYLGKVPRTFWYDLKEYTPQSFANEIVPATSDYIELMSIADLPYYKNCLLQDKFNWAGDSLFNIPLAELQALVDTALAKGWTVGWEGDVTNPGFNFWDGYAIINDSMHQYAEERRLNYKNETTERDHMLHLVGIGRDQNNKKWYYLKNSWGTWVSTYKGFLFMEENYFKLNTVILMVNKQGLPQSLKKKLGIR